MKVLLYKLYYDPSPFGASDSPTSAGRTASKTVARKHLAKPGAFVECVSARREVVVYNAEYLP